MSAEDERAAPRAAQRETEAAMVVGRGGCDPAMLEGARLALDGSNSFLIDQRRRAWLVLRGHVDLFVVPLHGHRRVGRRRHLLRVAAGELFASLPTIERSGNTPLGVVAGGVPGTEVLVTTCRELRRLDPVHLAELVDRWIAALSSAALPPADGLATRVAAIGGDVALDAGDRLDSDPSRVLWLALENGAMRLAGVAAPWLPPDGLLPLAAPAFARAEVPSRCRALETATVIDQQSAWGGVDRFHAAAMESLAERERYRDTEDRSRLSRQEDSAARADHSVFSGLAALLVRGRRPVIEIGSEAPLLAAFRLVAAEHGVAVNAISAGLPVSDNLVGIRRLAQASHVHFRWVVLGERWWRRDSGAMIGFRRDDGAPVALLPHGVGRYEIVDGADSRRRPIADADADLLNPQAVLLYRPLPEVPVSVPQLIRFGTRGALLDVTMVLVLGLLVGLLALAAPVLTGVLFDRVIPNSEHDQLLPIALGLLAFACGSVAFQGARAIALLRFEGRLDWQIQAAVFDRLLRLPVPFFRNFTSGDLADRALSIQQIRSILTDSTVTALLSSVFSFVSFGLLLFYSWRLALLAAVLVAVSLAAIAGLSYAGLRHQREQLRNQGQLDGVIVQFLIGIVKLRVAAAEGRAFGKWAGLYAAQKHRFIAGQRWANLLAAFQAAFPVLATVILFAAAAYLFKQSLLPLSALAGEAPAPPLETGSFLAFNAAFGQLMAAMNGLASAITGIVTVVPLFERSRPILQELPEHTAGRNPPGELTGAIEVSSVTFRYTAEGPPVLDALSLRVEPGQFVAIVGPSGSGKSTIFRLLLGFERPETGAVFYDGRPLGTLDVGALRRQIGVVLPNGRISAGSIFSNIAGGNRLGESEAWAAAQMAGLDRDIEAMPMGMHTVLPDGGTTLSGGQRQRLMIARALVQKPRILLLDDATSAIDNQTQSIIIESMARINTTRIVIAHRLSTITRVDQIFVVQNGKVAQTGTYAALSLDPGPFAELRRRQLL